MRFFTTMLLLACIPGYAFAALHSSADIRISGSPENWYRRRPAK